MIIIITIIIISKGKVNYISQPSYIMYWKKKPYHIYQRYVISHHCGTVINLRSSYIHPY